jgi:NAD-dependent deacetylase
VAQPGSATEAAAGVARLAELIRAAGSAVALTGAGISVPSGIPDFRSPGTGLWERVDPMEVAHIDAFRADPVRFWGFYGERFATLGAKRPNPAHEALAALERAGMLDAVITQNVDMLHRRAGTRELVEVHGSIAGCSCLSCPGSVALEEARARIAAAADGVPRCESCGEALKPDVILFGELLDPRALDRARELCEGADVLLCIGSSLEVHPVAALPGVTHAAGGAVAILTQGPTPLDGIAEVRMHGDVVAELGALLAALELETA